MFRHTFLIFLYLKLLIDFTDLSPTNFFCYNSHKITNAKIQVIRVLTKKQPGSLLCSTRKNN
jgi:hypothetical protein